MENKIIINLDYGSLYPGIVRNYNYNKNKALLRKKNIKKMFDNKNIPISIINYKSTINYLDYIQCVSSLPSFRCHIGIGKSLLRKINIKNMFDND